MKHWCKILGHKYKEGEKVCARCGEMPEQEFAQTYPASFMDCEPDLEITQTMTLTSEPSATEISFSMENSFGTGVRKVSAKFELSKCGDNKYYFNIKASNGKIIAHSEGYKRKRNAIIGIEAIRRTAANAKLVEL